MPSTPRVLFALNINDDDRARLECEPGFFDSMNISSVIDVQRKMRERSNLPIDLYLVDVNMSENEHPGEIDIGENRTQRVNWIHERERPYGPILALPFTYNTDNLSTFVPYSSHWETPGLAANGYVLVSVSLLLSQIDGKEHNLTDTSRRILEGRGNLLQDPGTALTRGARQLRERITTDVDIQLVDVEETHSRLTRLIEVAEQNPMQNMEVPLRDDHGLLAVKIYNKRSRLFREESIQVASLFLDVLDRTSPVSQSNAAQLRRVLQQLHDWKAQSISVQSPYENALRILADTATGGWVKLRVRDSWVQVQVRTRNDWVNVIQHGSTASLTLLNGKIIGVNELENNAVVSVDQLRRISTVPSSALAYMVGESVDRLAGQFYSKRERPDQYYRLVRLVMLFAWILAWNQRAPEKLTAVRAYLGLDGHSNPTMAYKRFLGESTKGKTGELPRETVSISTGAYRGAFNEDHNDSASKAYSLSDYGHGALTGDDKYMCQRYARDELQWHDENEWPAWMR